MSAEPDPASSAASRDRLSLIGHAAMPLMCPLTPDELLSLVAGAVRPGERVLDLGGGRGDLALLLATRLGCSVVSVDRSPAACEEARRRCAGAAVEVVCDDARAYLARARPHGLALACAVGAVHAFGDGPAGWRAAVATLAPIARTVLVADVVALGERAVDTFEVARREHLASLERSARRSVVLGPERVLAYERAWCAAVAASAVVREGDPRAAWARERLAWSEATAAARDELAFIALAIDAGGATTPTL